MHHLEKIEDIQKQLTGISTVVNNVNIFLLFFHTLFSLILNPSLEGGVVQPLHPPLHTYFQHLRIGFIVKRQSLSTTLSKIKKFLHNFDHLFSKHDKV